MDHRNDKDVMDHTPTDQQIRQVLQQCATNSTTQKCLVYSMMDSGLGSQLFSMFTNFLYLQQTQGYNVWIVEESDYVGYRYPLSPKTAKDQDDTTVPVLTGYFTPSPTPQLIRIDTTTQRDLLNEYLPTSLIEQVPTMAHYNALKSRKKRDIGFHGVDIDTNTTTNNTTHGAVAIVTNRHFHSDISKRWLPSLPHHGYDLLVDTMCPNLQFNDHALQDIHQLRQEIYPSLNPTNDNELNNNTSLSLRPTPYVSVSFHVRRTDKTVLESPLFHSTVYVQRFLKVLEEQNVSKTSIEICFLATDDMIVHDEMQQALHDHDIPCTLVYSPSSVASRNNSAQNGEHDGRYETMAGLVFMTELSVMLETTYFVGTYNSNVGALAAVLRGCPGFHDPTQNFAQSYGIDADAWVLH
jgi:hypothetical protein